MFVNRLLRVHAPALALAALCLTACGDDQSDPDTAPATEPSASSGSSPSDTPTADDSESAPPGTPDCSTVWSDGATLPRTYQGCVDGGAFLPPDTLACSSGQRMVVYADTYFAVFGGSVHEASSPLDDDRDYRAAVLKCRA